MHPSLLAWIFLVLGVLCRLFIPFLLKRREDPLMPFDPRFLYGQLVTAACVFLVLPFVQDLEIVATLTPLEAYIAGWFAADIGREADKFLSKA